MFKKLFIVAPLFVLALFSLVKSEVSDTVWCKYTYPTQINAVKFTPDGLWLATGGSDGVARIWDVATGNLVKEYFHSSYAVTSIDIFQNLMAVACSGNMKIFDLISDSLIFNGAAYHLKFSKDGSYLLTDRNSANQNTGITIIDTKTWKILNSVNLAWITDALDISPDNKYVARSNSYHAGQTQFPSVDIYNFPNLDYKTTLQKGEILTVWSLLFSSNQYLAGAIDTDGDNIWNTADWSLFRNFSQGSDSRAISFSLDNKFAVAGFFVDDIVYDKTFVYNIETKQYTYSYLLNYFGKYFGTTGGDKAHSIDVSRNSQYIAVGGGAGIYLLNAKWNPVDVPENPVQITEPIIFPNPANGTAKIQFNLLKPCQVSIKIYDSASNLIVSLSDGQLLPGMQNFEWITGIVPSGTYFCRITAAGMTSTIQIIVNK